MTNENSNKVALLNFLKYEMFDILKNPCPEAKSIASDYYIQIKNMPEEEFKSYSDLASWVREISGELISEQINNEKDEKARKELKYNLDLYSDKDDIKLLEDIIRTKLENPLDGSITS